jgi:hypothetical protein
MRNAIRIGLIAGLAIAWLGAAAQESDKESVACDVGPVLKVFGGNEWNVFSCSAPDQLVVVYAPGNPAMPFFFVLYMKDGKRKLSGEGTGSKEATAAAYDDLKIIADSEEMIAALIAETKDAHDEAE